MSNALAPVNYKTGNGAAITLSASDVRNYLVKGNGAVTDSEVLMYMHVCMSNGLDPFAKDAHLVKYGDSSPASIIMGKDAFMKRADSHPQYDGMDFGVIVASNGKLARRKGALVLNGETLMGGWCEVYRKDRSHPTRAEVSLSEYSTGKANWSKMPATMISKVAKTQALREAFPNQLAGMYDEAEIGAEPEDIRAEIEPVYEAPEDAAQAATAAPAAPAPSQAASDPRKELWAESAALKKQAIAAGVKEEGIASLMAASITNPDGTAKDMKSYTAEDIAILRDHLACCIRDMELIAIERDKADAEEYDDGGYEQQQLAAEDIPF